VYAGSGDVEISADQGIVVGDLEAQLLLGVFGKLCYCGIVDAGGLSFELCVFDNERFEWGISRSFSASEDCSVGGAAQR